MRVFIVKRKGTIVFTSKILLMMALLMLAKLQDEHNGRGSRIGKKEYHFTRLVGLMKRMI